MLLLIPQLIIQVLRTMKDAYSKITSTTTMHKVLSNKGFSKPFKFSVCTIANDLSEYEIMKKSFELCGFTTDCEYLLADNSKENLFNAYDAIRRFISESKAEYILMVHQDVRCLDHREILEKCLDQLSTIDSNWGICGNAGAIGYHQDIMYIDNDGIILRSRNLPAKVTSLDENFLIIKASSGITVSNNFSDFHLYGTDLCLIADILGYTCYVIPYLVKHLSHGNQQELLKHVDGFVKSYGKKLRSRYIQTTCTKFYLSNSPFKNKIFNSSFIFFFVKFFQRIKLISKLARFGKKYKISKTHYNK
jgi:hypothetical protein